MEGIGGQQEEGEEASGLSFCPSFNSYTSDRLAVLSREVALDVERGTDRQEEEERLERGEEPLKELEDDDDDNDNDDDFEFVPVIRDDAGDGFVISSDQIGPVFPVFNQDLLFDNGYGIDCRDLESNGAIGGGSGELRSIMIPLKDLFREEDHHPSSSSEADELDGIPEGSYCVWTPRGSAKPSPRCCKKSNSTGSRSSRRWRFLDLVRRSNSDRKDSFVLLTPSSSNGEATERINSGRGGRSSSSSEGNSTNSKSVGAAETKSAASALEVFYTRNKVAVKEGGNRRKSYLPYRQDLVGFFANVNSLGRTFPPLVITESHSRRRRSTDNYSLAPG